MELVPQQLLAGIIIGLFPPTVANPLEEIANEHHRRFMAEYVRRWPFLPQVAYTVGQATKAELHGVQQDCVVQVVDCSLIQVQFLVGTCRHHRFMADIQRICGPG